MIVSCTIAQFDIREVFFSRRGGGWGVGTGELFPNSVGPPLRFNKDTPDPQLLLRRTFRTTFSLPLTRIQNLTVTGKSALLDITVILQN